jgi:lipopolysaccharide biosynthesis regulator YciM
MKPQSYSPITSLLTLLAPIVGIIHLTQACAEATAMGTSVALQRRSIQATEISRLVAQLPLPPRIQQTEPFERVDALYSIALVYAEAGILERAREMAMRLAPRYPRRDRLLVDIAGSFAARSQFSEALNTAEAVEDPRDRAESLASIAANYAETGQADAASAMFEQALQLARSIGDLQAKMAALEAITDQHASVGNLSQAHAVAREIPIVDLRLSKLLDIAAQYDNQGQTAQALAIYDEVKAFMQNLADDECGSFSGESASEVATRLALAEGSQQALQFAESLTPCRRLYALQAVAQNYARTGQQSDAIALLDRAYAFFQSEQFRDRLQSTTIENDLVRLWIEFADGYQAVGQTATAIDMIKQAEVLARTLPQDYPNSLTLSNIEAQSELLIEVEKREQALRNQGIETEVLAVINAAISTARGYANYIRPYARTNPHEIARQILAQAEALALTLPEANSLQSQLKQFAWAGIAEMLAYMGEYKRALEIAQKVENEIIRTVHGLDEIQPTARAEESETAMLSAPSFPGSPPATPVMQLIQSLNIPSSGSTDAVLQGLERALALAQSTPQASVRVRELVEIAYWYAQFGQADKATAILEQAFAIAQQLEE